MKVFYLLISERTRTPPLCSHKFSMSADAVLNALYEQHLPFRLYADHKYGLTVEELACLSNKPVHWVAERIEAMRLCLEKQIRFDLASDVMASANAIGKEQIWR